MFLKEGRQQCGAGAEARQRPALLAGRQHRQQDTTRAKAEGASSVVWVLLEMAYLAQCSVLKAMMAHELG
ncbi:unnamed protein product [Urochloa humidicola]